MNVALKFVSLGFGHAAQCNEIWMIIRQNSAQAQRLSVAAKKEGKFLDLTAHRKTKSIIMFKNGFVAGSPFSVKTLYNRIRKAVSDELIIDGKTEREIAEALSEAEEDAIDDNYAAEDDEPYEDVNADTG